MKNFINLKNRVAGLVLSLMIVLFGAVNVANAETHTIDIKGFAFSQAILEVKVGDIITWTNLDGAPHTATATDRSWDTGRIKKGESKSITVTAGMVMDYFCNIHNGMKAKIAIN